MEAVKLSEELLKFISESPSMFHSVKTISKYLDEAGYKYLPEQEVWKLEKGGKYYTTRNGSSVIAFKIGDDLVDYHFQITAAHGDSPTYKVKSVSELYGAGKYIKLNIEAYGGMIDSTWFDKPLSVAGRVLIKEENKTVSKLLYIDKDVLLIPNVAIHMNRNVNNGYAYNRQVDLLPLFSAGKMEKGGFDDMVAKELGVEKDRILAKDLFLVNRQRPAVWGYENEFVSTPKLDDLQCAFSSLKAFIAGENKKAINVYACFDNEEVGSNTKQGAMSTLLKDVLKRINFALGKNHEDYYNAIAKSFLVSCDNAHAVHPNHRELTDDANCSFINQGIVIKESANQKYTSDAFSQAVFKNICNKAEVPVQHFANRSNMAGGSTLGNLSNTQVSVHAVDIGLPQLAMHSSYETAGVMDTAYAVKALTEFFSTNIKISGAEEIVLED